MWTWTWFGIFVLFVVACGLASHFDDVCESKLKRIKTVVDQEDLSPENKIVIVRELINSELK